MKDQWMFSKLGKKCISLYGNHDIIIEQKGNIGFVEYCRLCGEGQWVNLKKEVRPEEGIHVFTLGGEKG